MKLTNLFKRNSRSKISLCGKLEYIIGNYFLSGSGGCSHEIETLYYDSTVKSHDSFLLSKAKVIAYFLQDESIAIVRNDMLNMLKEDTKEYDVKFIPVENFDAEILTREAVESWLNGAEKIKWIDDDFMNDEEIEFDFAAFETIDSGITYLNPKHFSVEQLISILNAEYE